MIPSASPAPRGSRELREEHNSSGASSGGPTWAETLLIAIRWRSVLPSPAAPSCRCRPSGEAGTSVPITHVTWRSFSSRESEKSESLPVDNGDIVHNSSRPKHSPGNVQQKPALASAWIGSNRTAPCGTAVRSSGLHTGARRGSPRLPFRSHMPSSVGCPNPRPQCQSQAICKGSMTRSARRCLRPRALCWSLPEQGRGRRPH